MKSRQKKFLSVRELVLFSMFAALMFISKLVMEGLPNFHLLGMFTVVLTLVYRKKALIPIYVFVFLTGIYGGFAYWWIHHLYVWAILWGVIMLLPRKLTEKAPSVITTIILCLICGLHGISYGIMCSPIEALVHGFNLKQTMMWIAQGLSFDVIHCVGNIISALLILPLTKLLSKLEKRG